MRSVMFLLLFPLSLLWDNPEDLSAKIPTWAMMVIPIIFFLALAGSFWILNLLAR